MVESSIPWLSALFVIGGLAALAWSSDLFVAGASSLARAFGISPLIIGMVIIGFGTSAPEFCVSVMSGLDGHANISLGNAYGSDAFNIAIILGVSAFIYPLAVRPAVALLAGGCLVSISLFSMWLLRDGACSRSEGLILVAAFAIIMPLYCWYDQRMKNKNELACSASKDDCEKKSENKESMAISAIKLIVGLSVLIASSHLLIKGSVNIAKFFGVSDLVVGLTIVAAGTSLPELASAIASARRKEHEFVLGNIIGSNIFNTLTVVGVAVSISPIVPEDGVRGFSKYIIMRDLPYVTMLSLSLIVFGLNWRRLREPGRFGRRVACVWIASFLLYTALMFIQETGAR
jgi:cation:H+ antiporter